jgi:hypothetical protein
LEGQRVVIWGFDGTLRDSTLKTRQGDLPGYFSCPERSEGSSLRSERSLASLGMTLRVRSSAR